MKRLAQSARQPKSFVEAADSQVRDISGSVKLTTLDIYAEALLPPILLQRLRSEYPGIRIEIDTSQEPRDLAGGAADIALAQFSSEPSGGGIDRPPHCR